MKRARNPGQDEVRTLAVSVLSGAAINILTAETGHWWGPFWFLAAYPYIWVPASMLAWISWVLWRGHRRRPAWTGTEGPYPGLEPFTADRSSVFFGRDRETAEVLTRLVRSGRAVHHRFVPIVGPSGSGKSSLVRAGVVPRLPKRWTVVGPFRPATDPFLALTQALSVPATEVDRTARLLRDEAGNGGTTLLPVLLGGGDRPTLIIVDQLEDLFTLSGEGDRHSFLRLLADALTALPALHCLVTLRPEFNATAVELHRELFANPAAIGSLDMWRIREAIVQPAAAAGVGFETGLVDAMVAEATVGDALPLLGHLLQRLYGESTGGIITAAQYNRAGRVAGAIAEHADAVYQALLVVHPAERVDRALLQFVGLEREQPVRRRVAREALDDVGVRVIEEFRAARLVVDVDGAAAFELAHDALFRRWGTLVTLIDRNRQGLRHMSLLEQRAATWVAGHDGDDLLRGTSLTQAGRLVQQLTPSPALVAYLDASRAAEATDRQRQADHAAAWAQQLRDQDLELACAVADAAVDELAPSPAALLTQWGLRATGVRRRLAIGHTEQVTSLAWLPGTGRLRSTDRAGVVCTWAVDGRLVGIAQIGAGRSVLGPDGRYALVHDHEARVALWDVENESCLGRRDGRHGFSFDGFSWTPDGRFAGPYDFHTVDVYALRDGRPEHLFEIPVEFALATAWSPTADRLAVATNETLQIFAVTDTVTRVQRIEIRWTTPKLTWSPNGRQLMVTAGEQRRRDTSIFSGHDRLLYVYDVPTGRFSTERPIEGCAAAAWSPDGRRIVYGRDRGTRHYVELLDLATGAARRRRRHEGAQQLAWSPDGTQVAIAGQSHSTEIWMLTENAFMRMPTGELHDVSWSPDRRGAAIGRFRTPLALAGWQANDGAALPDLRPQAFEGRWSPDGLSIAGRNRTVVSVWDAATGKQISTIGPFAGTRARRGQHRTEADHSIGSFAWSADSQWLAVAAYDFWGVDAGCVTVWAPREQRAALILAAEGTVGGPVAWSPDCRVLATTIDRQSLAVWDGPSGTLVMSWDVEAGAVRLLQWCPDGTRIAVAADDRILVCDVAAATVVATWIADAHKVRTLCWSPDGTRLASAGSGHAIHIWQPETGTPLAVVDLPRLTTLLDLGWNAELTATLDDGVVLAWTMPGRAGHPVARTGRVLTADERRRYGLPAGPDAEGAGGSGGTEVEPDVPAPPRAEGLQDGGVVEG